MSRLDYQSAIPLLERAIEAASGSPDHNLQIQLRNNLASCHFALFNLPRAIQLYSSALQIAQKHKLKQLETVISYNIASLQLSSGQRHQALAIIQEFPLDGSTMQAESRLEGFLVQAEVFSLLQNAPEARAALRRALTEVQAELSPRLRLAAATRFPRTPEALQELRRAKALSIGAQCLAHLGFLREAEEYVHEAFRIRWTFQDPSRTRDIFLAARLARLRKDFSAASRLLEIAKSSSPASNLPVHSLLIQRELAQLNLDRGSFESALPHIRQLQILIRQLRMNILPSQSSALQFETIMQAEFYDAFFRALANPAWTLLDGTFAAESLWIAEEARFASLKSQVLAEDSYNQLFPAEYWDLLSRYQSLQTAHFRGIQPDSSQLRAIEAKLANFETQSGLAVPQSNSAGVPRFADWQSKLPANEVVYAFHLAEPHSLLWVITRDSVRLRRICGRAELARQTRRIREQLPTLRESQPTAETKFISQEIFRDFPFPKGTTPVVTLVLDQELHDLPFAALPSIFADNRFLLRDVILRVSPSLTISSKGAAKPWNHRAVALADPIYNRADKRMQTPPEATLGLNRLPGTAREVKAGMSVLSAGGWKTDTFLGAAATPALLRSQLQQSPDIIHIASHFLRTRKDEPWLGLALTPDENQKSIFGLADMRMLRTESRVVVLSGCETQAGEVHPGLGVNGLARHFLVAGAGGVLVTMWPIRDSAGPLFPLFYERLLRARPDSLALPEALRTAQLKLLDSGGWSAQPDYWASYVAITRG